MASETLDHPWTATTHQQRSRKTQEKILAASEKLLAQRPFRDIAVADIIRKARASTSSFYQRFGDKNALLGCLFERHAHAQRQLVDRLLTHEHIRSLSLVQIVQTAFPHIVESFRDSQGLIRAFLDQASSDERFRQCWDVLGDDIARRVTELVQSRSAEVDHPDPPTAVYHLIDFVFATLALKVQMHEIDQPQMKTKTEQLIQIMVRTLGIRDMSPSCETRARRGKSH